MTSALTYLEGVARLLEQMGQGSIDIQTDKDDETGRLIASLRLRGSYRLEVNARLRFADAPDLHQYSFQLLDGEETQILRYDNVAHHRDLPGFPHHSHRADGNPEPVIPAPSIRTILGAIEDEVEGRLAFRESRM